MQLNKIITLANSKVELQFLALERSIRKTGCDLPIWVIPYTDDLFELPDNAQWWKIDSFCDWLAAEKARPVMRKYQCLLESNYQFIDTDAIFLRDPSKVLEPYQGWVPSCCHWNNPGHTYTKQSKAILESMSTVWQKNIFNTGQFACDQVLYDEAAFKAMATDDRYRRTILDDPFHEQPGINLLVNLASVSITNLTLPPQNMESTWAGDYHDEHFENYWQDEDKKPYLIHWAGDKMNPSRPISKLFYDFLTEEEQERFLKELKESEGKRESELKLRLRSAYHAFKKNDH